MGGATDPVMQFAGRRGRLPVRTCSDGVNGVTRKSFGKSRPNLYA